MLLLNFTVRNHKSIRDEVTLHLTKPSLKTIKPKDGDWAASTYPIAGIFGANATGKSAIIDAIRFAFFAIALSATSWQAEKSMQHKPFLLDDSTTGSPSLYEIEFIHNNRRYRYGFEIDSQGVVQEWLHDFPNNRWRTLIDRVRGEPKLTIHKILEFKSAVSARELILSRSLLLDDSPLYRIAKDLTSGFDWIVVDDAHQASRLSRLTSSLSDNTISFRDLTLLLRVADIGVTDVSIEEEMFDLLAALRSTLKSFERNNKNNSENTNSDEKSEILDESNPFSKQIIKRMMFTHRGSNNEPPKFSISDESSGTISWLATSTAALDKLRNGGLLIIDELENSLHPHLVYLILRAFSDVSINTSNAQLVFTSHDPLILSPLSDVNLTPNQIWFTDKTYDGSTELTCLADFPKHPDANIAKRYLAGRYGGVPHLSPTLFSTLVNTH